MCIPVFMYLPPLGVQVYEAPASTIFALHIDVTHTQPTLKNELSMNRELVYVVLYYGDTYILLVFTMTSRQVKK